MQVKQGQYEWNASWRVEKGLTTNSEAGVCEEGGQGRDRRRVKVSASSISARRRGRSRLLDDVGFLAQTLPRRSRCVCLLLLLCSVPSHCHQLHLLATTLFRLLVFANTRFIELAKSSLDPKTRDLLIQLQPPHASLTSSSAACCLSVPPRQFQLAHQISQTSSPSITRYRHLRSIQFTPKSLLGAVIHACCSDACPKM